MKIVFIICLAGVVACNNSQDNKGPSSDSTIVSNDSSIAGVPPVKTDFTEDSVITIVFPKDSGSVTIIGKMRGINNPVTVNIPVTKGENLTASLVPEDSVANIRINQVFMPDGKADGPFGRVVTRKVTDEGTYKLIVGENLMQGDEWNGKFQLTVKVE